MIYETLIALGLACFFGCFALAALFTSFWTAKDSPTYAAWWAFLFFLFGGISFFALTMGALL